MHLSYRGIRYLFSVKAAQKKAPEATQVPEIAQRPETAQVPRATQCSETPMDCSMTLAYRGIPYRLSAKALQHSATGTPFAVIPLSYRGMYYLGERFTSHLVDHESLESESSSGSGSTEQG